MSANNEVDKKYLTKKDLTELEDDYKKIKKDLSPYYQDGSLRDIILKIEILLFRIGALDNEDFKKWCFGEKPPGYQNTPIQYFVKEHYKVYISKFPDNEHIDGYAKDCEYVFGNDYQFKNIKGDSYLNVKKFIEKLWDKIHILAESNQSQLIIDACKKNVPFDESRSKTNSRDVKVPNANIHMQNEDELNSKEDEIAKLEQENERLLRENQTLNAIIENTINAILEMMNEKAFSKDFIECINESLNAKTPDEVIELFGKFKDLHKFEQPVDEIKIDDLNQWTKEEENETTRDAIKTSEETASDVTPENPKEDEKVASDTIETNEKTASDLTFTEKVADEFRKNITEENALDGLDESTLFRGNANARSETKKEEAKWKKFQGSRDSWEYDECVCTVVDMVDEFKPVKDMNIFYQKQSKESFQKSKRLWLAEDATLYKSESGDGTYVGEIKLYTPYHLRIQCGDDTEVFNYLKKIYRLSVNSHKNNRERLQHIESMKECIYPNSPGFNKLTDILREDYSVEIPEEDKLGTAKIKMFREFKERLRIIGVYWYGDTDEELSEEKYNALKEEQKIDDNMLDIQAKTKTKMVSLKDFAEPVMYKFIQPGFIYFGELYKKAEVEQYTYEINIFDELNREESLQAIKDAFGENGDDYKISRLIIDLGNYLLTSTETDEAEEYRIFKKWFEDNEITVEKYKELKEKFRREEGECGINIKDRLKKITAVFMQMCESKVQQAGIISKTEKLVSEKLSLLFKAIFTNAYDIIDEAYVKEKQYINPDDTINPEKGYGYFDIEKDESESPGLALSFSISKEVGEQIKFKNFKSEGLIHNKKGKVISKAKITCVRERRPEIMEGYELMLEDLDQLGIKLVTTQFRKIKNKAEIIMNDLTDDLRGDIDATFRWANQDAQKDSVLEILARNPENVFGDWYTQIKETYETCNEMLSDPKKSNIIKKNLDSGIYKEYFVEEWNKTLIVKLKEFGIKGFEIKVHEEGKQRGDRAQANWTTQPYKGDKKGGAYYSVAEVISHGVEVHGKLLVAPVVKIFNEKQN